MMFDGQSVGGTRAPGAPMARDGILLFAVGLAARLIALPFAGFDSGDSAMRVWYGWLWADEPSLITAGVWGPLHYYLIGAALWLWPDPVWAPIALHVVLGAMVPVVVFLLALEMFGDRRAALLAGLAFAAYPTAIGVSILPRSETPFILLLGAALVLLMRARRPDGRVTHAFAAGLFVGLASMLRYEVWMLLPILALFLFRRPRLLIAFLVPALVHIAIWMTGNWIQHHDPFYSFTFASNWELEVMGKKHLASLSWSASQITRFIRITGIGLTLPLLILVVAGVVRCLLLRRPASIWLVLPMALFALLAAAAARGSLVVKWQYTATYGLLLVPYAACALEVFHFERWKRTHFAAAAVALLACMAVFMIKPIIGNIPKVRFFATQVTPKFQESDQARAVLALVQKGSVPAGGALVSDFYGWLPTHYVALRTKLHPRQICLASGAPGVPADVDAMAAFLHEHRRGVLITNSDGKLNARIETATDGTATLGRTRLQLEPLGAVPVHTDNGPAAGSIGVARYTVLESAPVSTQVATRCSSPCPVSLCSK